MDRKTIVYHDTFNAAPASIVGDKSATCKYLGLFFEAERFFLRAARAARV